MLKLPMADAARIHRLYGRASALGKNEAQHNNMAASVAAETYGVSPRIISGQSDINAATAPNDQPAFLSSVVLTTCFLMFLVMI